MHNSGRPRFHVLLHTRRIDVIVENKLSASSKIELDTEPYSSPRQGSSSCILGRAESYGTALDY